MLLGNRKGDTTVWTTHLRLLHQSAKNERLLSDWHATKYMRVANTSEIGQFSCPAFSTFRSVDFGCFIFQSSRRIAAMLVLSAALWTAAEHGREFRQGGTVDCSSHPWPGSHGSHVFVPRQCWTSPRSALQWQVSAPWLFLSLPRTGEGKILIC